MFIDVDSKKVIILVDGILKVKISRGEKNSWCIRRSMDMILKVILQTDVSSGLTSKCLYLSHIKSENLTWTKKFVIVHVCFLSHKS